MGGVLQNSATIHHEWIFTTKKKINFKKVVQVCKKNRFHEIFTKFFSNCKKQHWADEASFKVCDLNKSNFMFQTSIIKEWKHQYYY